MSKLLVVEASPQRDWSISKAVTAGFVQAWREADPDGAVVTRDLVETGMPFISSDWILGAFTSSDSHSPASAAAMRTSDTLIAELRAADQILISTPMHNLNISAALKAYIDQIVRVGSTVTEDNQGLVTGKKAAVIISSGGDFTPGSPAEQFNHASPYLRVVLAFIGITDVHFILAGPTRRVASGEETRDDFVARFMPEVCDIIAAWRQPAPVPVDRSTG